MRKFMNIFAAALIMLAAASCEKNEVLPDNNSEGKIVTLKASINNGGTKTSLGASVAVPESDPVKYTYPVLWSEGDAIAVIQTINEETKIFKFVLQGQGKTAEGEFRLDVYDGCDYTLEENAFNASAGIQAFYPFEGISLDNNGKLNYTVPATQTYTTTVVDEVVCSTFGNGVSPMAAYADDAADGLSFENLFGVLKFQLSGAENEKVLGIEIMSDDNLKGNAQLTIDDASKSISLTLTGTESSDKKVILKCEEGVSLSAGTLTDFLVALPANATNLKVLIHTNVGSYTKDIPVLNTNKIVAGQILLMPELILGTSVAPITYMEIGNGIAIPNSDGTFTIWAPVNCGYHATDYPYGKMYQWGRKDGHRYYPSSGQGTADAGGVTPVINWDYPTPNTLDPDTMYGELYLNTWDDNPCPTGWRVPTFEEGKGLVGNSSEFDNNKKGRWVIREEQNVLFLPCAGYLLYNTGQRVNDLPVFGQGRETEGRYWTSTGDGGKAFGIKLSSSVWIVDSYAFYRQNAYSVRCVKDMTQSQPMPGSN